jgi:F0F1-type ATP synthase delta subunit
MFSAEPWARAFLRDLAAEESETAFEALKLYCQAGLMVPGEVAGLNDARRFARVIDRTLEKAGLVSHAGSDGADMAGYARNFFLLMIRRGCFCHYKKITGRIQDIIDKNNGSFRASLEVPFEPDPAFLELVKRRLLTKTGAREVTLRYTLVPELVGGFRIRMGNVILDGSLRSRLARMAADLGAVPGTQIN